ncbi:metal-sensing transcriptional repressor [Cytobacillus horneckiae]
MNRIEGQIKGIKNMMMKKTYCDEILHQISAPQAALDSVC